MEVIFTNELIVVPAITLASMEIGARTEFWGIVREQENGRALSGLLYDAYEPMARREFERIAVELRAKHPIAEALVIHRLGWVPVGQASLFVRVQARNRGPALAFCGQLIDRMKVDVPIWKVSTVETEVPGAL